MIYFIKKGASVALTDLNCYEVGLKRLSEMCIAKCNFSEEDIAYIGYCSIQRIECKLCRVGNFWGIVGRIDQLLLQYQWTHGYPAKVRVRWIIRGKRIYSATSPYPRRVGKSLSQMSHKEIFEACQTSPCPKHHGRGNRHCDIGRYVNPSTHKTVYDF